MTEKEAPEGAPNYQLRFSGLFDVDAFSALRITMIGAGGIGAPSALALAKTGLKTLKIYDFDEVSEENVGPQMYGPDDIGRPKVDVLNEFLSKQAPWTNVEVCNERFEQQKVDCDILISAVDSMQVRKLIWRRVLQAKSKPKLLIDPRMGAELMTLFSVEPGEDDVWYRNSLEGDAVEATCTTKATFYTGLVAGAMVSQAVKAFVAEERINAEFSLDMRYLHVLAGSVEAKRDAA